MPYPWLKLYVETKDDPKILALSDAEFRVWINLLLNVSDTPDRGTMPAAPRRGLAATLRVSVDAFESAMGTFSEMGMAHFTDEGGIVVDHFLERQYDKPSDYPEATRERKAKERARDKSETPKDGHADVTPESRADQAESRNVTTPEVDRDREVDPGSSGASAPAPTAPKRKAPKVPVERKPPKNAEQFSALARIEGFDPCGPMPDDKRSLLNKRAAECADQKWTAKAIEKIAELWAIAHPDGPDCTANVVPLHGARLLAHPPRGPAVGSRTNGKAQPSPWPAFEKPSRTEYVQADGTITDADGNFIGREGDALN